jgi:bacteriorhodopsin
MAGSALVFMGLSLKVPAQNRVFYYIMAATTLVTSAAYFTMASNLGYAAIQVEFIRSNPEVAGLYREVFYVRYIGWFITTPVSPSLSPFFTSANNARSSFSWLYS